MATRKTKSSALGDDPLAWITDDVTNDKSDIKKVQRKKTQVKKTKANKKLAKRNQAKKTNTKKIQDKKVSIEKGENKNTPENVAKKTTDMKGASIKLDSVLVINDVQIMYSKLSHLLKTKQNITIDATAVEMLDTAMLQLLLAFVIKVKAEDREVTWITPSEEMINRVATLNLQAGLGLEGIA